MRLQLPSPLTLTIDDLGSHGEGVGSYEGFKIFVEGVLPGETVKAEVFKQAKNYAQARLIEIITPHPDRQTPPCPLFEKCGGCQLMHLSYKAQTEFKTGRVQSAFQRIGKFENTEKLISPCLPAPSPHYYRNKIQIPVGGVRKKIKMGLYAAKSHQIISMKKCLIHTQLGNKVFQQIHSLIKESKLTPYHEKNHQGQLRHVIIKTSQKDKSALLVLVTNDKKIEAYQKLARELLQPPIIGVVQNINTHRGNTILGKKSRLLAGKPTLEEDVLDLTFSLSAVSFFQVNLEQMENLYQQAVSLAQLKGNEIIVDAFCGIGTLSLYLATQAKRVIGIEKVEPAIKDARKNAEKNGISNAEFICGLAEDEIGQMASFDLLFVDPPRKGCEKKFLEAIIEKGPHTIIYISCDPATLARDCQILSQGGYRLETVQPVDMFPQTNHIECIAKLSK